MHMSSLASYSVQMKGSYYNFSLVYIQRHTHFQTQSYKHKNVSLTFSSFSKCSRKNFIGRSGFAMQRFTMHSFRICWILCFCTNISQPFKLSSSSRVEEEVAILSFISVAVGNRVDHERRGGEGEQSRDEERVG